MQLDTMYAEVDDRVATIVLNRPEVLNCINEPWLRDFNDILDRLCALDRLRVVVIRGAGRAFCSGIDLKALSAGAIGQAFFRGWEEALRRIESLDLLFIAAIHSHCVGGGLQLALACDLRVARSDARFGVTAVKEGIIPGMGMWRIARHAGLGRAKRLALTADVVDAETAERWGLVERVTAPEVFDDAVTETTNRLLAMAWTSTRLTKKLIDMSFDAPWSEALDVFCEFQRQSTSSPEHREAMAERRELAAHGRR